MLQRGINAVGRAVGISQRGCWVLRLVTAWVLALAPAAAARSDHSLRVEGDVARAVHAWILTDGQGEPSWDASGVEACRIEVRFEGMLEGEGQAVGEGCVVRAAREAIEAVRAATLQEPSALGRSLAVSIELAGSWVPMSEEEIASPDLLLHRGLNGVGARWGEQRAAVFASAFHGVSPVARPFRQTLSTLAAGVLDEPLVAAEQPVVLATQRGVEFFRFEIEHWAQAAPGGPLLPMYRGGALAPMEDVLRPEGLRAHIAEMVDFLSVQAGSQAVEILTADAPAGATLRSRATVLLALERAAGSTLLSDALRDRARAAADEGWGALAAVEPDAEASGELAVDAAGLLLLADRRGVLDDAWARESQRVLTGFTGSMGERVWQGQSDEAIALLAISAMSREADEGDGSREAVDAAIGAVLAARGVEGAVALLPWIAWADASDGQELQAAAVYRQAREAMWANQFGQADMTWASQDFRGGLVFAGGGLPGATSIRPVLFAAWALGEPALTTSEELFGSVDRRGELIHVAEGLRFLAQLKVDEAAAYRSVVPSRVAGGVRRTLWDSQVYPEDTALALMAFTEALETFGRPSPGGEIEPASAP